MNETAFFLLAGLSLYAGGHHLYLGRRHRGVSWAYLRMGGLYGLLAGFAVSLALAVQSNPSTPLRWSAGTLAIGFESFLWIGVLWHVTLLATLKRFLLLDLLTAAWLFFFLARLTGHSPGPTRALDLFPSNSSAWTSVELLAAASLVWCGYAGYRLYRQAQPGLGLATLSGAVLLGLVTLYDHLVGWHTVEGPYLAPFGFALFLLPISLYPLWLTWRRARRVKATPVVYSLSYSPDQAWFHTDVAQLQTPVAKTPATEIEAARNGRPPITVTHEGEAAPPPAAAREREVPRRTASAASLVGVAHNEPVAAEQPLPVDAGTVNTITDSLIDIAVYATMALNRFKRGDADPQTLESLCRKIRTQAIKTRRLTHQLLPEQQHDDTSREDR